MNVDQTTDGNSPAVSPKEEKLRLLALYEQCDELRRMSARLRRRCQDASVALRALHKRSDRVLRHNHAVLKSLPRRTYE